MTPADEKERTTVAPLPFPGAVDDRGHVTFTLFAPGKQTIHLIGDFNDWDVHANAMREIAPGLWSTEMDLAGGSYSYQYLLNGEQVVCDPYAKLVEYEPEDRPPRAVVRVKEEPYLWRHEKWNRPRLCDLMIYELHIADFTPERSFRGAAKRLDYIKDLGMTAIELMPVFEVATDVGWGYAPTFMLAPNRDYGTGNELRLLIDEAHSRGIAVILDVVLGHTGHEHPFNKMYPYDQSPWYGRNEHGENEFGLPTLSYSKEPTLAYVRDVIHYWLRDYHVDGFRFDYLKIVGSKEDRGVPTLVGAAREVREDVFLIAERVPEDPAEVWQGKMDAAWHIRISYALKALLTQREVNGYSYGDFEKSVKTFVAEAEGYKKPTMMINYLESHDEQRGVLAMREAGFDDETARHKSALAATALFTMAGEPMLYHGQEWGEASKRDMEHNFIGWETLGTDGGKGLREHYQKMIALRAQHDALRTENLSLDRIYSDKKCAVFHRWNNMGDEVVVALNFSPDKQTIQIPFPNKGQWKDAISGAVKDVGEGVSEFEMSRYSGMVFVRP
jgi:1,4-alpha-glucan branching enzyme